MERTGLWRGWDGMDGWCMRGRWTCGGGSLLLELGVSFLTCRIGDLFVGMSLGWGVVEVPR